MSQWFITVKSPFFEEQDFAPAIYCKAILRKKLSLWYVGLRMSINVIRLTVPTSVLFHLQAEPLFRSLDFGVVAKEYA